MMAVFGMHKCPFWYEWSRIGVVFRFLSLWGGFFRFRCMTPPSPLLETLLSVSFSWVGSWIRLSGVFFRRIMYFSVLFSVGSCWIVDVKVLSAIAVLFWA
jgi:hypothetical protein